MATSRRALRSLANQTVRRHGTGSSITRSDACKHAFEPKVAIEKAIEDYLVDSECRGLETSTLSKLNSIFRRQFLSWCQAEGRVYLNDLNHDSLLRFRSTWSDDNLTKQKKYYPACDPAPAAAAGSIRITRLYSCNRNAALLKTAPVGSRKQWMLWPV